MAAASPPSFSGHRGREDVLAHSPRLGHSGGCARSAGWLAPHGAPLPTAHMWLGLALLLASLETAASVGIARAAPHRTAPHRRSGLHARCCVAPHSKGPAAASAQNDDQVALDELQRCVRVAELEALAQACEASGDLRGEVAAYEALLAIEPPDSHWLSAATSARRGLQELLLQSGLRELAACDAEGCRPEPTLLERVERAAEATRQQLASRALSDVGRIRGLVVGLLDRGEAQATLHASRARDAISYLRLIEGEPAILASCVARIPFQHLPHAAPEHTHFPAPAPCRP